MPKKYPVEVKGRAVPMVREHEGDCGSLTAASVAVGGQLGIARETLRRWVGQAAVHTGARPGVTTSESEEVRAVEDRRLRGADETLRSASVLLAPELAPHHR